MNKTLFTKNFLNSHEIPSSVWCRCPAWTNYMLAKSLPMVYNNLLRLSVLNVTNSTLCQINKMMKSNLFEQVQEEYPNFEVQQQQSFTTFLSLLSNAIQRHTN